VHARGRRLSAYAAVLRFEPWPTRSPPRTANSSPNSCRARKLYDIDNWIASGYYISGPALIRFLERLRSDGHGRVAKASQQVDYYRIAEEIEQVLLNDRQHMSSFVKI
jgi:hypothetical protein